MKHQKRNQCTDDPTTTQTHTVRAVWTHQEWATDLGTEVGHHTTGAETDQEVTWWILRRTVHLVDTGSECHRCQTVIARALIRYLPLKMMKLCHTHK